MVKDLLKVGACSLAAIPGDIEENIEKIKLWTEKAVSEDIELLLFPELSLSGYWTKSEIHYEAQPKDGEAIQELTNFLKELNSEIAISVGLAESYGGSVYNTQIILDKNGVRNYYRKTHWAIAEVAIWSCGDKFPVHDFYGTKVGTAICYDNIFPEVHRIYGLKGADLVLSPYAYGDKFDFDDPASMAKSIATWKNRQKMLLCAAATSNYLWIVAVVGGGHVKDYIAQEGGEGFESYLPGVILFIDPEGNVVLESSNDIVEERLMSYQISRIANIEQRKLANSVFKNRRVSIYNRIWEIP
jgi:predicted amidohydrolase